ncbi:hypothetical protein [Azoarcus sp. TTM-91]|uniref:hypothetical protein n=1 Tax=Azoarcus sp. TTM-91 TaxID=2691581 RepID=UPI001B7D16FE|nr:hypothetical protein [Azoarcus sp. TTM-91]
MGVLFLFIFVAIAVLAVLMSIASAERENPSQPGAKRGLEASLPSPPEVLLEGPVPEPAPQTAPGGYRPNHIPAKTRVLNVLASLFLLGYGAVGLYMNDLFVPAKGGKGVHFHGSSAWLIFFAMLCACANLISVVVDHYDHRDNEIRYSVFARYTQYAGWVFFVSAFCVGYYLKQIGT